jgi:HAMP domain-containing protein
MNASTIVALTGLIVALGTLLTAVLAVWKSIKKDLQVIHVLVNSQLGVVIARVAELTASMHDQGATVPAEKTLHK